MHCGSGGNGVGNPSITSQLKISKNADPIVSPSDAAFRNLLQRKSLRLVQTSSKKGGDHISAALQSEKPSSDDNNDAFPATNDRRGRLTGDGKMAMNKWIANTQQAAEETTLTEVRGGMLLEDEPPLLSFRRRTRRRNLDEDPFSSLEDTVVQDKQSSSFCDASSERSSTSGHKLQPKKQNHLRNLFIPMSPSDETSSRKLPQIRVTFVDSDKEESSTLCRGGCNRSVADSQPEATISEQTPEGDDGLDTLDSLDCISESVPEAGAGKNAIETANSLNQLRLKLCRHGAPLYMPARECSTPLATSKRDVCNELMNLPVSQPECFPNDAAPTSICGGRCERKSLYSKIKNSAIELNSPSRIASYGDLSESTSKQVTLKPTSIKHFVNSVAKNKSKLANKGFCHMPLSIQDDLASGSWDSVSDLGSDYTQAGGDPQHLKVAASIFEISDTDYTPPRLAAKLEKLAVTCVIDNVPSSSQGSGPFCANEGCLPHVTCFNRKYASGRQKKYHNFLMPIAHDTIDFISENTDPTASSQPLTDPRLMTSKAQIRVNPRIVINPPTESDVSDIDTLQVMHPARGTFDDTTKKADQVSRQLQNAALQDQRSFYEKSDCGTLCTESSTFAQERSVSLEAGYQHARQRVSMMKSNAVAENQYRDLSTPFSCPSIPPFTLPEVCESMDPSICTHVTTDKEEGLFMTNCSKDAATRCAWYTARETALVGALPSSEGDPTHREVRHCTRMVGAALSSSARQMKESQDTARSTASNYKTDLPSGLEAVGNSENSHRKRTLRIEYGKGLNALSKYRPGGGIDADDRPPPLGIELQDREASPDISSDNAICEAMLEKKVPEIRFRMLESLLSDASFGIFTADQPQISRRESNEETPVLKLNPTNVAEVDRLRCQDDTLITAPFTPQTSTCAALTTVAFDRPETEASCVSSGISDDISSSSIYRAEEETNSSVNYDQLGLLRPPLRATSGSSYYTESLISLKKKRNPCELASPSMHPEVTSQMRPISLTSVTSDDAFTPTNRVWNALKEHTRRKQREALKPSPRSNHRDGDMTPAFGSSLACPSNATLSPNPFRRSVEVYYDVSPRRKSSGRTRGNHGTEVRVSVELDRNTSSALAYDMRSEYSDHESVYFQGRLGDAVNKPSIGEQKSSKKLKSKKKHGKSAQEVKSEPCTKRKSNGIIFLPQMNLDGYRPEEIPHFEPLEDLSAVEVLLTPGTKKQDSEQGNISLRRSQVRQSRIEETSAVRRFAAKSLKLHIVTEPKRPKRYRSNPRGKASSVPRHSFRLHQRQTDAYDRKVRQLSLTRLSNTNNNACVVRDLLQKRTSLTTVTSLASRQGTLQDPLITISRSSSAKETSSAKKKSVKKKAKPLQNPLQKQSVSSTTTQSFKLRQRKNRSLERGIFLPSCPRRPILDEVNMADILLHANTSDRQKQRRQRSITGSRLLSYQGQSKRRNSSRSPEREKRAPRSRLRSPPGPTFIYLQARKNLLKQNLRAAAAATTASCVANSPPERSPCSGDRKRPTLGFNPRHFLDPSPQLILRPPVALVSSDSSYSLIPPPIPVDKTIRPTSSCSDKTSCKDLNDDSEATITEDRLYRFQIARGSPARLDESDSASPRGRISSPTKHWENAARPPNDQWASSSTGCLCEEDAERHGQRAYFPPFCAISVDLYAQRSGFGTERVCGLETEEVGRPFPPARRRQHLKISLFSGPCWHLVGTTAAPSCQTNQTSRVAYYLVDPDFNGAVPWKLLKKTQVSVGENRLGARIGPCEDLRNSLIIPPNAIYIAPKLAIGGDLVETQSVLLLADPVPHVPFHRAQLMDPAQLMKRAFPRSFVFGAA